MATWFDGNWVQHQKPETLEKRLLTCINRQVVVDMKDFLSKLDNKFKTTEETRAQEAPIVIPNEDHLQTGEGNLEEGDQAVQEMDGNDKEDDLFGF
ncbi:hypothetical protein ACA910_019689 [Epithemia clementina (nom. ined.)]